MTTVIAGWHRASFDTFLHKRLPELLERRMPLTGYTVESTDTYTCRMTVALSSPSGEVTLTYPALPQPDPEGVFAVDGRSWVVVPVVEEGNQETVRVQCAGEQLYGYIAQRLGDAPEDLPLQEELARAWLPLDRWFHAFITGGAHGPEGGVPLEARNWLSRAGHLRRVVLAGPSADAMPRPWPGLCPFETPEGPNVGRIRYVSLGADIRDGRLVVVDDRPEAAIGLAVAMIPFLEHDEPVRAMLAAGMMRQWVPLAAPEPALIRTGQESDDPAFWQGVNLLTACMAWDVGAHEDGLVISASCAQKLRNPEPLEPGDKLSNRHGVKGVVTRILPDEAMPKMADGTPVDLIMSLMGIPSRMNMGLLREAALGRLAKATAQSVLVPLFHAPDEAEIRRRLREAGLPEHGMETLSVDGRPLPRPSAAGWVYWGCTEHLVRHKIHACAAPDQRGQRRGQWEYYMMRDIGAYETIREAHNTLNAEREDASTLPHRLTEAPVDQAGPPSPGLAMLMRRLAAVGIRADLQDGALAFRLAPPEGRVLRLTRPMPHPWLPQQSLEAIGILEEMDGYRAVYTTDARLERMIAGQAPDALIRKTEEQLNVHLRRLFEALLGPDHLRFSARVLFSARTVAVPGEAAGMPPLGYDRAGLPEDIAWTLFGPHVTRELREEQAVKRRTPKAAKALDALMAQSWVLLMRAPVITPTGILAFRPVRTPGRTLHVHPFACDLMNLDFDGDQMAVFLPVTEAAQREAEGMLTLEAHLARDPDLLVSFLPAKDALFGLTLHSLTGAGREEIHRLAGTRVSMPEGYLTRGALLDAMRGVLAREGAPATLERLDRMMRRGFELARASGASIGVFAGSGIPRPAPPVDGDPAVWEVYAEEVAARIAAYEDYQDPETGALLLASRCGARAQLSQLTEIIGAGGVVNDAEGKAVPIRHGFVEGLSPQELYALAHDGQAALWRSHHMQGFFLPFSRSHTPPFPAGRWRSHQMQGFTVRFEQTHRPRGHSVLARAMRSSHPGIVFARAAAAGEADPLTDVDARLFVGLGHIPAISS